MTFPHMTTSCMRNTFTKTTACSWALRKARKELSREASLQWQVSLTVVMALGLAPCCSRTLMMWVWPCWAAWCRGVYPFCYPWWWQQKQTKNKSQSLDQTFHFAPFCSFWDISNINYDINWPKNNKPSVIIILLPQNNGNIKEGNILFKK